MSTPVPAELEMVVLKFPDKGKLYSSYMPFVKHGGLFIPAINLPENKDYKLRDRLFLELHFMEEKEKFVVNGKVIWITPVGAQGSRAPGIGVQFEATGESVAVHNKIQTYLAGMTKSDRPTDTM